jgi:hypothetical protein
MFSHHCFAVLLLAAGLLAPAVRAAEPPADRDLAAWVEQRVRNLQPTAAEKRFDEIAWAKDIRTALRLAKEHNRPVFLFTHDGRINTGRC